MPLVHFWIFVTWRVVSCPRSGIEHMSVGDQVRFSRCFNDLPVQRIMDYAQGDVVTVGKPMTTT